MPRLIDVEIAQALRRCVRGGRLEERVAASAPDDFRALDLERHSHEALRERVWTLRDNMTG